MTITPKRIQRRRIKGWRKPEGVVLVDRTSRWGNPYEVSGYGQDSAVRLFRWLVALPQLEAYRQAVRDHLRGKDLGCWCPLDHPCHADVLLEIANQP
jgi:Domain of unknown function (DUF4326)